MLLSEAKVAHRLCLTPNRVSVLGFLLSLLSAAVYGLGSREQLMLLLAVVLFLSSGFCDTLDGILARHYQQASVFGGFLDSVLDRYADAAVFAGIIIGGLCEPVWGLAALIGSMLVSYSRARAEAAGIKMESVGFAERAERMLILSGSTLVAIYWFPALNIGIILLAVLSNLTVLQRVCHVYNTLKKKREEPEN